MTVLWRCCYYGAVLVAISSGILAYNFDVDNLIVYEDPAKLEEYRGTYSGFSVALWNPGNRGIDDSWIFIGAPRANSSQYRYVNEPGSVWKCKIGEKCHEWVMDSSNGMGPVDGSWLGGSMGIESGTNPNVVVCGPRWLDKHIRSSVAWPMTGICYQASAKHISESNATKGIPLSSWQGIFSRHALVYYVMGESGFSIHIVPDSDDRNIVLGCPGLSDGHGTPIQYSIKTNRFLLPYTANTSPLLEQYGYSGYAVTSGHYFGQHITRFYATSAPRSGNLLGRITIFRFPARETTGIIVQETIVGKQVGEYFGSVLASCDINGDGFDDLIVGAPQWTKMIDEGRIYVYRGNNNKLQESQIFEGKIYRGRFGTAITCLGDIDHDNYDDIAVGAPYDGSGTVYIYRGSKDGLIHSQTIPGPRDTKGFGISISEPRDIDNNGYADIAVGAYLSGHVTLLRSKRAVITNVNLTTDLSAIPLKTTPLSFGIKICSSYSGKHAPQELNVIMELKVDEIRQRAEIISEDGKNQKTYFYEFSKSLNLHQLKSCDSFTINMKTGDQNVFEPLKLLVTQRLNTINNNGTLLVGKKGKTGRQYFDSSSAVMDELHSIAKSYVEIPFALKCDNRGCNSHLSIEMATSLNRNNTYVIGSDPNIELNIRVNNTKDQAYYAKAVVIIPNLVQLSHIPSTCERQPIGENIQVTCDIANPLNKNEMKSVSLSLDMSSVTSNTSKIFLNAIATTQSNDTASGDHKTSLQIICEAQTDIGITRKNTVDRYSYTLVGKEEQLPSIAFQHIYEIKNYKETRIDQALLSLSIPTHWIQASDEIEIVRINKTTGYLDEQEFNCMDAETDDVKDVSSSFDATTNTEWLSGNNSTKLGPKPDEKFTIINGKVYAASPENRTMNINCTNPSVKCKTIICKLGSFGSTQSVAKLALMFDLLLSNFTSEIIQDKDIIFFVTNSSVKILGPPGETLDNKPNLIMIGTLFTGIPPQNGIPAWIIAVSVFVGLLLLILVILALFKFGFFKRTKQMELRALLEEKDEDGSRAVPESTSRR